MKTGLVLPLLLGCALLAACGSEEAKDTAQVTVLKPGQLTVCTSLPYEPFEFMKDGEPAGFDIDLIEAVADRLQLESRILAEDFDALQSGQLLNEGKCDVVIAALTITGERAKVLDFSSPYFSATQALVSRRGVKTPSIELAQGLKIGVEGGTTGELYATDHAARGARIVALSDPSAVESALDAHEIDLAILDSTIVNAVLQRHPNFRLVSELGTGEQYGIAVMKNSNDRLLREINSALSAITSQGDYDAIYRTWFGEPAG